MFIFVVGSFCLFLEFLDYELLMFGDVSRSLRGFLRDLTLPDVG